MTIQELINEIKSLGIPLSSELRVSGADFDHLPVEWISRGVDIPSGERWINLNTQPEEEDD